MKESLSSKILTYLKEKGTYINGGEIERFAISCGKKASNASRRLREMENAGLVIKELRKGEKVASVWYKAIEVPKITVGQSAGIPRVYLEGRKEELSGQITIF